MENGETLLQCYNKGCGQKYDSNLNNDKSCCHHPGEPFFHDAYKGWSCCNKKCTDFTEFLNIKGCTRSKHSNIKPKEPEKPIKQDVDINEVIEVKPIVPVAKVRPPFESPMTMMKPEISPSLKQQVLNQPTQPIADNNPNEIPVGTICKNGGCNASYQGSETSDNSCIYHPGVPIFHEGLKFWSCCQKRTTDFNAFLNQVGCEQGNHVWIKENDDKTIQSRWDYHQTASHVVVSIYAKQYCLKESVIQLNPVRLKACLVFPQQSNATFKLDIELQGIVDVSASQVFMYATKVEIKLKKAEAGSWSKLEIPRTSPVETKPKPAVGVAELTPQIDAVDLDDL
ncbi:cysteine and histidine-rich domain-containing protein [Asbolus verrucosus]|uniref:Cysteine and histidine-rich domain-containing protein n=1 Tax=Asbolus verrucosus TaxID=1661398 RepID=A0A482WAK8_ASBVE|nr:cysteine and histidine-rich domain-containing protein [Asbolus verrucosus]